MSFLKEIEGGVCAPAGFKAGGIHCGLRKNKVKKDVALIVSSVPCVAAGVFTQNIVKGAPVVVSKRNLQDGIAQAVICNSGNANTCNAGGEEVAEKMCELVTKVSGIPAGNVLVASTGVIGQPLDITPMESAMDELYSSISAEGGLSAAEAIMTTDTVPKTVAVEFSVGGKTCRMGAMAKGVGMICPNMATTLIFITSDVSIGHDMLQKALSDDVKTSFNMVSIDGDQSTNDTCCILCNGLAGNEQISAAGADFNAFKRALHYCTVKLSRMIAKDGEGATKLLECNVKGAKSQKAAKNVAKAVIKSSLVKAAMFGADANWGRVLCAAGYSGEQIDPDKIDVDFTSAAGVLPVCKDGRGVPFDEDFAKKVLSCDEIQINICLNSGRYKASAWGCDLTYDYVKINGDYRT